MSSNLMEKNSHGGDIPKTAGEQVKDPSELLRGITTYMYVHISGNLLYYATYIAARFGAALRPALHRSAPSFPNWCGVWTCYCNPGDYRSSASLRT